VSIHDRSRIESSVRAAGMPKDGLRDSFCSSFSHWRISYPQGSASPKRAQEAESIKRQVSRLGSKLVALFMKPTSISPRNFCELPTRKCFSHPDLCSIIINARKGKKGLTHGFHRIK